MNHLIFGRKLLDCSGQVWLTIILILTHCLPILIDSNAFPYIGISLQNLISGKQDGDFHHPKIIGNTAVMYNLCYLDLTEG